MDAKLLTKLRKILALTASPHEGEARLFAEKLQEMLLEHNLQIADLEQAGQNRPALRELGHDLGKAAFAWKLNLAEVIADHYFCVAVVDRKRKTVIFVGRPDNVESLQMLYGWLIDQIKRISSTERVRHHQETQEHIDPLRWQLAFGLGVVSRLRDRLAEIWKRRAELNAACTTLVVSHASEASDFLEEKYGYRLDGKPTAKERQRQEERRKREEEAQKLKETDLNAYYEKFPWERPLTPEQAAAKAQENAKWEKEYEARERRNRLRRERYEPKGYRLGAFRDERKDDETYTARQAGAKAGEQVNLEPFLTDRKTKEVE